MKKSSSTEPRERVLVALGGNAILRHRETGTAEEQLHNIRNISRILAEMVAEGYHVAITHGNGPQVGDIVLKNEIAKATLPPMPLDVCGAESQGMIGYMLQQSLHNELLLAGIDRRVATFLTQTVVDEQDPAFNNPRKPIGPFYTAMEAKKLREKEGWVLANDAGHGYRRVVPSPEPVEIVEGEMIRSLFDEGYLVIAAGGGGIPVAKRGKDGSLAGIEAVIDKDHTAAMLARVLTVEILLVLTDVDNAFLNYGRQDEEALGRITAGAARRYLDEGHFGEGNMGPKIESALRFLADGGKSAVITSPSHALEALSGNAGTTIRPGN
jgi:carbamate kinase